MATRTPLDVYLGKAEQPIGRLIFVKDGQREFSQFAYSEAWLADARFFDVSPDLNCQSGELWRPAGFEPSRCVLARCRSQRVWPAALPAPRPV